MAPARRRLRHLMAAGWLDSLLLSYAWTLVILEVVTRHGLAAAGAAGAAMLIGTALSAPVATQLATRLCGRSLLRVAAAAEAVLRVSVFALLFADASLVVLCLCITAMNVTAWTGYAGMRAEVDAAAPGPGALTWYGTGVAAVEALGVAAAAVVPVGAMDAWSPTTILVVVAYVAALAPTVAVAGSSPVLRTRRSVTGTGRVRPSLPLVSGVVLMALASAPTLLAVALAQRLHGRDAVALAAVAFTVGSLSAPSLARRVARHWRNGPAAWATCAVGMVALWPLAYTHVAVLCAAQALSGLSMTALEGLLDSRAADEADGSVTGALARVTAGRALGSAAGTAVLPAAVVAVGLTGTTAVLAVGLGLAAAALAVGAHRFGSVVRGAATPLAPLAGSR